MSAHAHGVSPQAYARFGGLVYLIIIVAGTLGEVFIRGSLIVAGDAAATASHLVHAGFLWRVGIVCDLTMHVCDVFLMLVFYLLFRPVSRPLALLVVLFNLVTTAVLVANKLNLLLPLLLLGDAAYLQAFTPAQLQALAYVAIRAHGHGFGIGLIFFGVECLLLGGLIIRCRFLPRALGVLMAIAGVCYLTNSVALLLYPPLADRLFPAILLPCSVAELSLALWLLLKGVDAAAWTKRASEGDG